MSLTDYPLPGPAETTALEEFAWAAHAHASLLAVAADVSFEEAMTTVIAVSDALNGLDPRCP